MKTTQLNGWRSANRSIKPAHWWLHIQYTNGEIENKKVFCTLRHAEVLASGIAEKPDPENPQQPLVELIHVIVGKCKDPNCAELKEIKVFIEPREFEFFGAKSDPSKLDLIRQAAGLL